MDSTQLRDEQYRRLLDTYRTALLTRLLAKIGGFFKRKKQPYADRGVVITLEA